MLSDNKNLKNVRNLKILNKSIKRIKRKKNNLNENNFEIRNDFLSDDDVKMTRELYNLRIENQKLKHLLNKNVNKIASTSEKQKSISPKNFNFKQKAQIKNHNKSNSHVHQSQKLKKLKNTLPVKLLINRVKANKIILPVIMSNLEKYCHKT